MADRQAYFRKFPITVYRGIPALNLLRRVDFNSNVKNFYTAFYAHTVDAGERIETLAHDYYGDVDYDWLIYHANDIIDPYYGVPLEYDDFEKTVIKKYGSIERAKKRTAVYKTNYEGDIQIISVDVYNNLPGNKKKYWDPVFTALTLTGYERKSEDIYISTNRIISFSLVNEITTLFTNDETVTADNGATATVSSCTNNYITLQHVSGDWNTTSNLTVTGDDSGVSAVFNHATYTLLQHVIPETEQIYFSKYSYYDLESDVNEQKREISLVDTGYAVTLNDQLDKLMS